MTVCERLPARRGSTTFDFEVAGLRYTATVSRFSDGRIGELFINNHKSNSSADTKARDAAIAFSIAVQHRADSEVIRRALCRNSDGGASGARYRRRRSRKISMKVTEVFGGFADQQRIERIPARAGVDAGRFRQNGQDRSRS
jgi:hypothetical protein